LKRAAFLLLATLSACGGGSPAPERPITGVEYCKVRLVDDQCPVDEIGTKAPSTGGLLSQQVRQ
jgi:hypothetical protein